MEVIVLELEVIELEFPHHHLVLHADNRALVSSIEG